VGQGCRLPRPLLPVRTVTAHQSSITVLLYNGPLLCSFTVHMKGLNTFICCTLYKHYSAISSKSKVHATTYKTRGQSNLTKSASRGAYSPVRGHPRPQGVEICTIEFLG